METLYNGIMFRSQLEARWAAFMDLCHFLNYPECSHNMEWSYEIKETSTYLPDFEVHFESSKKSDRGGDIYLEIKPSVEMKNSIMIYNKIKQSGLSPVVIAYGDPELQVFDCVFDGEIYKRVNENFYFDSFIGLALKNARINLSSFIQSSYWFGFMIGDGKWGDEIWKNGWWSDEYYSSQQQIREIWQIICGNIGYKRTPINKFILKERASYLIS